MAPTPRPRAPVPNEAVAVRRSARQASMRRAARAPATRRRTARVVRVQAAPVPQAQAAPVPQVQAVPVPLPGIPGVTTANFKHKKAPNSIISRHGHALPYAPTIQPGKVTVRGATYNLKARHYRGNPPGTVTDRDWDFAYNRADSNAGKGDLALLQHRLVLRVNGMTRDAAIDELIRNGPLLPGFIDINP